MARALGAPVLLLVLGGALAACTHVERTSKAEYERGMRVAVGHLQQRLGRIGAVDTTRPRAAARQLRATERALDEIADEFDAIEPPEDVAAPHERLVDAMRRYAAQIRQLAGAAEAGDLRILQETDLSALDGNADVQAAAVEIREKGYAITPTPRRP